MGEKLVLEGVLNLFEVYGWGVPGIDVNNDSLHSEIRCFFEKPTYSNYTEHQWYEEYGRVRITIERIGGEQRLAELNFQSSGERDD